MLRLRGMTAHMCPDHSIALMCSSFILWRRHMHAFRLCASLACLLNTAIHPVKDEKPVISLQAYLSRRAAVAR